MLTSMLYLYLQSTLFFFMTNPNLAVSLCIVCKLFFFFFQAEDGIRDKLVTGVQTCALPICRGKSIFHQIFQSGNHSIGKWTSHDNIVLSGIATEEAVKKCQESDIEGFLRGPDRKSVV